MKWNCFDAEGNFLGVVDETTEELALLSAQRSISTKVVRVEERPPHMDSPR
jgi:hypothetical protein